MVKLLIIDKLGSIGELNIKNLLREDLYKKCNYRKSAGFELLNTWKIKHKQEYIIEIHGKRDGKAGLENKYEFPPIQDVASVIIDLLSIYFNINLFICSA